MQLRWLPLLLGALLFTGLAYGQAPPAAPPAGGYALRSVQRLTPVPQPPGGLVPFCDSLDPRFSYQYWGYCDTLGQVWIKPEIRVQGSIRPFFFLGSFGQYTNEQSEEGLTPDDYVFINAHGETLRADKKTVVVQEPDGSLSLRRRRDWLWKPVVHRFLRQPGTGRVVIDTIYGTLSERPFWRTEPIGTQQGRGLGFHRRGRPPKQGRWPRDESQRGAMLDEQGRRLTKFAYWRIFPFTEGVAEAQRTGYFPGGGIELLSRQGRKIIPGREGAAANVSLVSHNRVALNAPVGEPHGRSAIIDTTGRLVRDWQPGWITWAIPGFVFSEVFNINLLSTDKQRCRLLAPRDGHVLFDGQRFQFARPLPDYTTAKEYSRQQFFGKYYPTALVRDTTGRYGLLGADLQWRFPCSADRYTYRPPSLCVRVGGKWGVLDVRDGRAVVPVRYDSLTTVPAAGWQGAIRAGQPVVLYQGREIAVGRLELPAYSEQRFAEPYAPYRALRRADGYLTLIDTTGRPIIAWLPDVQTLSAEPYLRNGLVLASRKNGNYSAYQAALLNLQGQPVTPWGEFRHMRDGLTQFDSAVYNAAGRRIADEANTELLAGGWVKTQYGSALIDSTGKRYAPPPGRTWSSYELKDGNNNYEFAPFERGVMYLSPRPRTATSAIVTRGGRRIR